MLASDIIARLESIAPRDLAFEFDITGLISGDPNKDIGTIGVSWAATRDTLTYFGFLHSGSGQQNESVPDMLILHEHPFFEETSDYFPGLPFFSKPPNINRIKSIISNDVCTYVMGTNFDEAEGGTADIIARALGINTDAKIKAGRIGNIEQTTFTQLLHNVKNILGLDVVRYVTDSSSASDKVSRIGVFIGYGLRSFDVIEQMYVQGAQVIISTGINHRTSTYISELGLKAIDIDKKKLESPAMKFLAKWLETNFKDRVNVISYDSEDTILYI